MLTIFAFNAVSHNPHFADGIVASLGTVNPAVIHAPLVPGTRKVQYTALDAAWKAGFDAAIESEFADVYPAETMTDAEMKAFVEGAREGYKALEFSDPSDPRDLDFAADQFEASLSYESAGYWHC